MKKKIISDSGGHWYTGDGEERHTTVNKTGPNKGKVRKTTLRDARKNNFYPSITSILKDYPKGSLDKWIKEQVMLAMHNNPPNGPAAMACHSFKNATEAQTNYFRYIDDLSNVKRDEAAKRGTYIHNNIENMLLGKDWDDRDIHLCAVKTWMDANVKEYKDLEISVVNHKLGVAGRMDASVYLKDGSLIVLDFKGRGFSEAKNGKLTVKRYKTDPMQLAFYAKTVGINRIANLYVANDRPEPMIDFYEYSEEEVDAAWEALQHFVKVWQYEHNYKPEFKL
jgi:hypothetical protein